MMLMITLPKTNIAPKKWWFPIGGSIFRGELLLSGRVSRKGNGFDDNDDHDIKLVVLDLFKSIKNCMGPYQRAPK